jgi:hypothetical protein
VKILMMEIEINTGVSKSVNLEGRRQGLVFRCHLAAGILTKKSKRLMMAIFLKT